MRNIIWIGTLLILLITFEPIFKTGLLLDTIFRVAIGWIFYLKRVVPNIEWNSHAILSGVVFAGLTIAGLHYVGRALFSASAKPWRWSWTWMIALMTCIAFAVPLAAGSIAHQAAWLTRSPFVTSNRSHLIKSISNARQMTTALQIYYHDNKKFPDSLEGLIHPDIMDREDFSRINHATFGDGIIPQPWIYIYSPGVSITEDLPVVISPFEHKNGIRVVGYASGTSEGVNPEKLKQLLPQWKKRCAELGITEPFIFQEMEQSLVNAGIQ